MATSPTEGGGGTNSLDTVSAIHTLALSQAFNCSSVHCRLPSSVQKFNERSVEWFAISYAFLLMHMNKMFCFYKTSAKEAILVFRRADSNIFFLLKFRSTNNFLLSVL